MSDQYAFHPEFVNHATVRGGWPKQESIQRWCDAKRMPYIKQGVYFQIMKGQPGSYRQVAIIVAYLRAPEQANDHERGVLDDYLRARGATDPAALDNSEVVERVTVVEPTRCDWKIDLFTKYFCKIRNPAKNVGLFDRDQEHKVREAVRWLYVESGRQLGSWRMPTLEAMLRGQERINLPMAEYEQRAVAWWRRCRWSVVQGVGARKQLGMCIILPVNAETYQLVRSGGKRTYDVTVDDFEYPSSHIIVEGVGMKPVEPPSAASQTLPRFMANAMICQGAWQTRVPGACEKVPVRMLTFKGTPPNTKRALRFGYKPTGTFQRGMDIEFMERIFDLDGDGRRDAMYIGVWRALQKMMEGSYLEADWPEDGPDASR